MISFLRNLFRRKPKPRRLDLRCVDYTEGDKLVREGWTIAPEEDRNTVFGMVWLERLEDREAQP